MEEEVIVHFDEVNHPVVRVKLVDTRNIFFLLILKWPIQKILKGAIG